MFFELFDQKIYSSASKQIKKKDLNTFINNFKKRNVRTFIVLHRISPDLREKSVFLSHPTKIQFCSRINILKISTDLMKSSNY